jgi:hypothetical protein
MTLSPTWERGDSKPRAALALSVLCTNYGLFLRAQNSKKRVIDMKFRLTTYRNGKARTNSDFDDLAKALLAVIDVLGECQEYEVVTVGEGVDKVVAYGCNEDWAAEQIADEILQDEVTA